MLGKSGLDKNMNEKKGLVIKSTGSFYQLEMEDGSILTAQLKGKLRTKGIRSTNPVAVGDYVFVEQENQEETVVIKGIEARKNYIIRKATNLSKECQIIAANIDQAILLVTLVEPVTTTMFIDRFLLELLIDKVSVISGHSGVGKSTLINAVDANLYLKTGEISSSHQSGKHTTTFAEMFPLQFGGYVIDTPGVRGFGLVAIKREELGHYFREIFEKSHQCKYNNCYHIQEPDCAVIEAVEEGEISVSRYENYLRLFLDEETKHRL